MPAMKLLPSMVTAVSVPTVPQSGEIANTSGASADSKLSDAAQLVTG